MMLAILRINYTKNDRLQAKLDADENMVLVYFMVDT